MYHADTMDSPGPGTARERNNGSAAARLLRPAPEVRFAAALRGFGPLGVLAILVILFADVPLHLASSPFPIGMPLSAVFVLLWAWLSRTAWGEIGYVRPKSWRATIAGGLLFGSALKLLMKALVMPLLGAPAINPAFHFLVGNRAAIPAALFAMSIGAGFGEETMFRGYLFERFGKLFGQTAAAKAAVVLLTSLWFGLDHYAVQGLAGAEQATLVELVFSAIMARTGRIFFLMFAHAAFDLTAYALIYWNLESRVAHLFFT
jgi:membrane protease YdiL (CAAX protease family)